MDRALLPEDLWLLIAAHLPAHRRSPKGGRPRIDDRAALTGILFVLKTGIPWEYLPRELGCGSGMTCWRRLHEWMLAGVWQRIHEAILRRLREHDQIMWDRACVDAATYRHLPGASIRAETRPIAANSEANTIRWWMSVGFH
jgi:transposase